MFYAIPFGFSWAVVVVVAISMLLFSRLLTFYLSYGLLIVSLSLSSSLSSFHSSYDS